MNVSAQHPIPRNFPSGGGATRHGLPNSNQAQEAGISQAQDSGGEAAPSTRPIDRRAIPPDAAEGHWQAPDGHHIRRIDWPGAERPPRGSILFFPGRGDHYEKYLESLEEWHRAGWRVTASDWRGQGASGRLGRDRVTGHVGDFADWVDDLAHLWTGWREENPGPHVVAGHSMGGHLVLRAAAEERIDPAAMVLSAPMLGFPGSIMPAAVVHAAARLMSLIAHPARPAWKWSEKPGETPARRIELLTHDEERYADEQFWREARPDLVMGPGSWGWIERALASMRGLFGSRTLEKIEIPTLILATSADRLVDIRAIERAAARLPRGELVKFGPEARHEILREIDPVRDKAMAAIAEFLDRAAPRRS